MELQCRTYLGKNPGGLVKVLYFAADQDFDRFFDEITDKILKQYKNVAFYYSKDPRDITDEVLDSMKLAVCPVTVAFLRKDCLARELLFDRILKKHIALLPILKEPDIARIFRMVCGQIQYLNAVKHDDTALDYDHKLRAFLDDILIDDGTSAKIRDAFDAYIFLSYRKKDRRYANEIMRLIHKNDFMRDVAIWYDEYLVPGENYSDAIEDAILKSKLVTLVVTPNLVNEDNYVKRTEYPMVHEIKKPVLPIRAQDTDEKELKDGFAGLPEPLDVNRPDEVTEALLKEFKKEGMKENNDPDHLFFIALAYLYGIDVETDVEKAVDLLERAGKEGSIEASRKLIQLYMQGQYVQADYYAAGLTLSRLILQLRDRMSLWDKDDYLDTIDYLRRLSDVFTVCREYDGALKLCVEALNINEEMERVFQIKESDLIRAQIYRDEAYILTKHPDSRTYTDTIMELYEEVCATYFDYFDTYGYDADWDILPLLGPMTRVSGEDQFRLGLDADNGLAVQYFGSLGGMPSEYSDEEDGVFETPGKEFLDLCHSFAGLVNDRCAYIVSIFPELDAKKRESRILELKDYEKTVKAAVTLLIKNGRDEDGVRDGEAYYREFGSLYLKMGELQKAKEMYEMAFSLLFDRYDRPDIMLEQLENAKNLIKIGDLLDDRETLRYSHFALSELSGRLYDATGAEEFRNEYDENEREITRKHLENVMEGH
ncbi:MAG: TIR domain-containing protein [Lachnospiraceae bacterium]|nr:TIR domain-containing protein [Lachnospiraceae bacterium]